MTCQECSKNHSTSKLEAVLYRCPGCGSLLRMPAHLRGLHLADEGTLVLDPVPKRKIYDPIGFPGYRDKINELEKTRGRSEALISGRCRIGGVKTHLAVMDFSFMGGSLGGETGRLLNRVIQRSLRRRLPLVFVAASGGARMQEGVHSLMAMRKLAGGAAAMKRAGIPLVCLLTDPVSGGMTASLAMLGDVILAEPDAFVGFAGPRVLKAAGCHPEKGDQSSNRQFESGFVDRLVEREELPGEIGRILISLSGGGRVRGMKRGSVPAALRCCRKLMKRRNPSLPEGNTAVRRARDYRRKNSLTLINSIFDDFIPLSGDRKSGDDPALIGGPALLNGWSCMVIAIEKGGDPRELMKHRFAMVSPSGYRKAARLIETADRLKLPILTLIDTPGADASIESEHSGIGEAIASLLQLNSRLRVPMLSLITGQGGSGGALALTNGRDIIMQSGAIFSVIMPEGCASIVCRDVKRSREAAAWLGLEASALIEQKLVRGIFPEPEPGIPGGEAQYLSDLRKMVSRYLSGIRLI